ncbi:transcriptional regulator [Methylobacterium phyllostachyos]|uniref:transcriptional regulator n=1 Tax=Methylobacterium phyllostachyos TaxID=582672 RepID=UPI001FCE0157|nr:transcriptional regulator [Methylobacterium phyllostachyos]
MQKLIHARHDGPCDTDDGLLYLKAALPHLMRLHAGPALLGKVLGWAQTWLPKVPVKDVVNEADPDGHESTALLKADDIARMLRVTREERESLRFRTIGAVDFSHRQRLADRRRKNAEHQAAKRLKAGTTPRSESNVAKAKALGISLSTYKRRLKQAPAVEAPAMADPISSAIVRSTYNPLRDRVTISGQTVLGPARAARPSRSVGAVGHAPGAKTRAIRPGQAVALPLPKERVLEHPDMLGGGEWRHLNEVVTAYEGGFLPDDLVRAVRAAQRVRQMTQEAVARQIGISRPQLANALQGRFGLSRSAAANLLTWLAA